MIRLIAKYFGDTDGQLVSAIFNSEKYECLGYTDKNIDNSETLKNELRVFNVFDAVALYKHYDVDGFIFAYSIPDELLERMVAELVELGVREDDIFVGTPEFIYQHDESKIKKYKEYYALSYLEFHVADHCNLNCKGCVHFSPLVEDEVFPNFAEVRADFLALKNKIDYIQKIHILGGEPFLNKEIDKYFILAREIYPYAKIEIVTNGLLVKSLDTELLNKISEFNIGIFISVYPPMYNSMGDIIELLKKHNIKIRCTDVIFDFAYTFDREAGHAKGAKKINCKCPNLYKGKLYVCPPIAYGEYFNKKFGNYIDLGDGAIDIYDEHLTYEEIKKQLHSVKRTCDWCMFISSEDQVTRKWEQTVDADITDYVYGI